MTGNALSIFDRIPDLLAMAREEVGPRGDVYRRQDALRKRFQKERKPYRWSMPMRHFLHCPICGMEMTDVKHELGDGTTKVELNSGTVHEVREHGVPFPPTVEAFLLAIADRL